MGNILKRKNRSKSQIIEVLQNKIKRLGNSFISANVKIEFKLVKDKNLINSINDNTNKARTQMKELLKRVRSDK